MDENGGRVRFWFGVGGSFTFRFGSLSFYDILDGSFTSNLRIGTRWKLGGG